MSLMGGRGYGGGVAALPPRRNGPGRTRVRCALWATPAFNALAGRFGGGHGRLWPNRLWPNRLWPKPTLAKTDFGQTDVGQTDVGQTDVGQNDVGQNEFDLLCVVLCCVLSVWRGTVSRYQSGVSCVGVGFKVWFGTPFLGPSFPWTAQNFALFCPSPAAKFVLFFPLWVSSR